MKHSHHPKFNIEHLFHAELSKGALEFANDRAILLQQQNFLNLRSILHEQLGSRIDAAIFFRFGYENAQRDFEFISHNFHFEKPEDLLTAGPTLHTSMGVVTVEPQELVIDKEQGIFFYRGKWLRSYEAEAYLAKYGQSKNPVCFSLCGYGSGWCSSFFDMRLLEIETQCMAQGYDHCQWEIRPLTEWGEEARPWLNAAQYHPKSVIKELETTKLNLMRLNEDLELKIKARTNMLQTLMRILCHDLKEPLLRVSHILKQNPEIYHHLKGELRRIHSLIGTVQAHDQFATLAEAMQISMIEHHEIFSYFNNLFTREFQEKHMNLRFQMKKNNHFRLLGDKNILFTHVFPNLIHNALKASSSGSEICIILQPEDDYLLIQIRDQGMGIPAFKLKDIQESLREGQEEHIFIEGHRHGIGLRLTASLVRAMNGSVEISSSFIADDPLHHGTICSVYLPLVP